MNLHRTSLLCVCVVCARARIIHTFITRPYILFFFFLNTCVPVALFTLFALFYGRCVIYTLSQFVLLSFSHFYLSYSIVCIFCFVAQFLNTVHIRVTYYILHSTPCTMYRATEYSINSTVFNDIAIAILSLSLVSVDSFIFYICFTLF